MFWKSGRRWLRGGGGRGLCLASPRRRLRLDDSGTEFAHQDRLASAEAIENFLEASEQIEIDDLTVAPVENSASESMEISGVSVSIRPDAYLKDPVTGDIKGAIKLHFPKTTPLTYVVDVSTQTVSCAPKSHVRKMNDIAAACEEIDARWRRGNS